MCENGGECGDDDEWGDLITTPNRLISDEFFVLKAEEIDDRREDCEDSGIVSVAPVIGVSVSSSPASVWPQFGTMPTVNETDLWLDSPIMLPNSQGSPTTGTFAFPSVDHQSLGMYSAFDDSSCDSNSLTYQPHGNSLLWPCISDLQNQTSAAMQPPILSQFPTSFAKQTVAKNSTTNLHSPNGFKTPKSTTHNANGTTNQTSPTIQPKETTMRNSEDGYNWRKYGQKQVKGSEYPRSYYKCTHPNCQVKKKVERSHDGHITEIIYKGAHNHQGQRNVNGSTDTNGSYIKYEDGELWGNIQQGGNNNDNNNDGMELSSLTSVINGNNNDQKSVTRGKAMGIFGNSEFSHLNNGYDVNEDGTHMGQGDEGDEDKSDLKRRKKGNFLLETSLVTRAMREPRVVVQIESEVDILDDGYRWRKYGQKVVKGNPNPRSYYKCTTTGCPVRKHVERASDDIKSVLTTYEGKHNHEIPAARNSTHTNIDVGSTTNNNNTPKIPNLPKPEPQNQNLPINYTRKLTNDYIPSNFLNYETDPAKFDTSSIYQTKFFPYQSPFNSVLPDFPMSLPPSGNMVHSGFGFINNGKRERDSQSFIGQQLRDNNARFVKPKLEQDDGFYDTFLRGASCRVE